MASEHVPGLSQAGVRFVIFSIYAGADSEFVPVRRLAIRGVKIRDVT
jgi:hypothetical protein